MIEILSIPSIFVTSLYSVVYGTIRNKINKKEIEELESERVGKMLVRKGLLKGTELAKAYMDKNLDNLNPMQTVEQNGKQVEVYSRSQIDSILCGKVS